MCDTHDAARDHIGEAAKEERVEEEAAKEERVDEEGAGVCDRDAGSTDSDENPRKPDAIFAPWMEDAMVRPVSKWPGCMTNVRVLNTYFQRSSILNNTSMYFHVLSQCRSFAMLSRSRVPEASSAWYSDGLHTSTTQVHRPCLDNF